jgi:SAM-dependent methyltransferase
MWKQWYEFLASRYKQEDWNFMNYGFANPGDAQGKVPGVVLEAADESDRCSIQLYHAVVGGVDLTSKSVMEVGSGRGGGCSYIARYMKPQSVLGIDYSDNAVELSKTKHVVPGLNYQQGDAENLPCKDGTFDAVLNVESSHCYGSMERFLSEVHRVLKPGGYFLWVDMRPKGHIEATKEQFRNAGFTVVAEQNITNNVVAALDQVNDKKRAMISGRVPGFLAPHFEDFAGVKGKRVYNSLQAGEVEYWRCALQKSAS